MNIVTLLNIISDLQTNQNSCFMPCHNCGERLRDSAGFMAGFLLLFCSGFDNVDTFATELVAARRGLKSLAM